MSTELRWQVAGDPALDGKVMFDEFRRFLDQLARALRATERDMAEGVTCPAVYVVETLSYSSPAQVGVRAPEHSPEGERVIRAAKRNFHVLRGGNRPEGMSDEALDAWAGLGRKREDGAVRLTLIEEEGELDVPHNWYASVKALRNSREHYQTSYRGVIKDISVDNLTARMEIPFAPYQVNCRIRKAMLDEAIAAVNKWADFTGVAHGYEGDRHPDTFTIADIEVLPPMEELPTANEIIGSMPDLTGGLGAVAYLKELRDAEG